jgi:hypothetical protein
MNSLAQPRINLASVADERPQRLADVMADDKIGKVVLFRRFVVNDD